MTASSVVNGLSTVAEYLGPYLIKHTKYMISPERYIKELENAVKELEAAEAKILHRIEDEKMRGYGIEVYVYEWLGEVKGLKERMWKLIQSDRHPVVKCFNGVVKIPKAGKRHRLALQAVKGMDEVVTCFKKDRAVISYPIHQQQHHHHLGGTNFINLETRTTLINNVLRQLDEGDEERGMMIGIYGIRGVGKTTLVKMIEVGARDSGKYAKVEIAAGADVGSLRASIVNILTEAQVTSLSSHHKLANKPPNVHKEEAAEGDDEKIITTTKNARPLDSIINNPTGNNKMRVLIIVDNLSYKIDLATYIVENKNNYKLQFLVTSTSNDLLASISCRPIQQLRALSDLEARQLLTHLISPDKAAKLRDITEDQLRNCCGGLPVFIEALARIINRSNSVNLWDDAVNQLPRNLDSVDTVLELSYNQLEDQVKLLYSLCVLQQGQPSQIEHDLFRYSVGMGLFDKINTIAAARKKMSEGLKSLLGSSLLLGTENNNQITIQDARRDFAVNYAFKSHYASSNLEIFIIPDSDSKDKDISRDARNDDFHDNLALFAIEGAMKGRNNVLVLRNETQASIFISRTNALVDDPKPSEMESIFQFKILEKLKVLHLERLCFTAGLFPPPSSLERHQVFVPKDLVTLCLHNCDVKDMSGIGNLESLQVVSFFGSVVAKLLKEAGELKKLRSLDFRGCLGVKQIEAGALEGLSNLEELFLGSVFDKWEVYGGATHQKNASLVELNNMNRLATLDVCIPNPDVLPEYVAFSTVLKRFNLVIGEWDSEEEEAVVSLSRTLKLDLDSSRVLLNGWFQATMKRAQQLHLKGLTDDSSRTSIHELCISSGGTSFEELKRLEIRNCPSTRYVVRSTEWFARTAFTRLEFLSLDSLINLEKIGHGLLSPKSFGKLKTVAVRNCENLGSLFSFSSIHGLSKLERIEIYKCNRLQAIIVDERTYDDQVCASGVTLFDKTIHSSLTQHVDHEEDEDEEEEEDINTNDQESALSFNRSSAGPTENEDQAKVKIGMKNQNSCVLSTEDGKIIMHELRELIIENSPNLSTFFTQVQLEMTDNNQREDTILNIPACLFCGDDK